MNSMSTKLRASRLSRNMASRIFLNRRPISVSLGNVFSPGSRSPRAAKLRGDQCIDLGDIHQRLNVHLLAFRIARPAGWSIVHRFNAIAADTAGVGTPRDDSAPG